MALINARQIGLKQTAAPAVRRTRVVKVAAAQQKTNFGSAVAAAAAAVLLVSVQRVMGQVTPVPSVEDTKLLQIDSQPQPGL